MYNLTNKMYNLFNNASMIKKRPDGQVRAHSRVSGINLSQSE